MSRVKGVTGPLVAVFTVPAVLLLFVFANGGYVWRDDCMTARGSVETSYSYRINQLVPYLAPSEPGCSYYSGTRVLASAVGFWEIPTVRGTSTETSSTASAETARFVTGASEALEVVSRDWERQKGLEDEVRGLSRSETIEVLRRSLDTTKTTYEEQIDRLRRLPDPSDDDLVVLRSSLTDWMRLQLAAQDVFMTAFESGASREEMDARQAELADDLQRRRATLLRMRAVLPSRYPELDSWSFLNNTRN